MQARSAGLPRSPSVAYADEPRERRPETEISARWEKILSARPPDGFSFVTRLQESLDRRRMGALSGELDEAQAKAIDNYVSESYAYVNDYLSERASTQPICRYGSCGPAPIRDLPPTARDADYYEARARTLCGALQRLPAPAGAVLYKGSLRSVELAESLECGSVRIGDCLTNVSFLSASESPFCVGTFARGRDGRVPPKGVIFVFTHHRSFKAIAPYSNNPVECEALCPPGASFVIVDAVRVATATKGRFWLVTLDESDAGARPLRDLFGRHVPDPPCAMTRLHSIPGRNIDRRLITLPATTKVPSPV